MIFKDNVALLEVIVFKDIVAKVNWYFKRIMLPFSKLVVGWRRQTQFMQHCSQYQFDTNPSCSVLLCTSLPLQWCAALYTNPLWGKYTVQCTHCTLQSISIWHQPESCRVPLYILVQPLPLQCAALHTNPHCSVLLDWLSTPWYTHYHWSVLHCTIWHQPSVLHRVL